MTPTNWQTDVYLIFARFVEPSILIWRGTAGWTLPVVRINERMYSSHAFTVTQVFRETWGLDSNVLRCVAAIRDDEKRLQTFVYSAELRQPAVKTLLDETWANRQSLKTLAISPPEIRSVIEACLLEAETADIPRVRPPWARVGWFDQASAWMQAELTQSGYILTDPIEQVRSWGISCLLRAQTTRGSVYFKVATRLPLFGHEPLLMQTLSALYPDYIPAPLSIDRECAWMLLADFGQSLDGTTDINIWQQAILTLGKIQRESIGRDLIAAGCLDRRLTVLADQIDPLLNDPAALSTLNAEERRQIGALGPMLKAMCHRLSSYRVPETLMHGDLNAGNIAVPDGKILIFDWTDGCVAHPFFDLCPLLLDVEKLPDAAKVQASLLEAYLALWTDFEPPERLREIWSLAEVLGALHQAVSYQYIVANLEPTSKRELESGLTFFLRQILLLHKQSPGVFRT